MIFVALSLVWSFSANVKAQTSEATRTTIAVPQIRAIKNLPYSAEGISETVQTLADGNKIKRIQKERMFRDSEGRTRNEYESTILGDRKSLSIYINDPVTGFRYRLNPDRKTAIRSSLNAPRTTIAIPSPPKGYSTKSEDLGNKIINGIETKGHRSITTIAAGTQGNEKELQSVSEYWSSTELRLTVYSKSSDPRNGERIFQLENLKRDEPDETLFKVPSDYKIIDQEAVGSFLF